MAETACKPPAKKRWTALWDEWETFHSMRRAKTERQIAPVPPVPRLQAHPRRKQAPAWNDVDVATGKATERDRPVTQQQQQPPITRETLRAFINQYCIKRVPRGSRELPALEGDGYYEWQFYLRAAVLVPHFLSLIANSFWQIYRPRFAQSPFQLAGVEQASIPILTALLLFGAYQGIPIRGFTIRKERKSYGARNLIEGMPSSNLPVVIVDDLTSETHRSLWHSLHALSLEKLRPYPTCFVLVRKQRKNDDPVVPTSLGNITVESMFTLDDFVLRHEDSQSSATR